MINGIIAFGKALLCGTLAGGGPLLLLTVPIVVNEAAPAEWFEAAYIAVLPILIAGAITLLALIIIGFPLTAYLRHIECEDQRLYAYAGAAFGFIIPLLFLALAVGEIGASGLLLIVPGILSGGTTGYVWGGWREGAAGAPHRIAPNRIHDERILR